MEYMQTTRDPAPFRVDLYSWQEEVTASATVMEFTFSSGRKVYGLIDCGINMEESEKNSELHFDPSMLDFVIATHAHADHVGRLPMLYKNGCNADIYCSLFTSEILELVINDAERIMLNDARINRTPPLYGVGDSIKTKLHIQGKTYFHFFSVLKDEDNMYNESIDVMLIDNGHLMGASSVYITASEGDNKQSWFITGDFKSKNPLKKIRGLKYAYENKLIDFSAPVNILTESTYGEKGRNFQRQLDIDSDKLASEIIKGIEENKTLILPTISLERPNIVCLEGIKKAQNEGKIPLDTEVYFVGPLLIDELPYIINYSDLSEKELMPPPQNTFYYRNVIEKNEKGECYLLKEFEPGSGPKIILASSGMCTHGQSVHLLRAHLPCKKSKIIFTSYLAEDSLGRKVQESELGDVIQVAGALVKRGAEVTSTAQCSGHDLPENIIKELSYFENIRFIGVHHGGKVAKRDMKALLLNAFPSAKVKIVGEGLCYRTDKWGWISEKPIPQFLKNTI